MRTPQITNLIWHSLMQLKHSVTKNRSAKNNSVSEKFKKFSPTKTLQHLIVAEIYHKEDIELWEQVLRRGTPRKVGEVTIYDFYMSEMLRK
jgi:hypothetical protein